MKIIFYLIIAILTFFSCSFDKKGSNTIIFQDNKTSSKNILADTLVKPFQNSSYTLKISNFNKSIDKGGNNTTVILSKNNKIIFTDSLSSDFL